MPESARSQGDERARVHALRVEQWLRAWDRVDFDPGQHRRKPEPSFLLFSLPAYQLKRLCGIRRRSTEGGEARGLDLGIQRRHEQERSTEIAEFVRYGFPWSVLSSQRRNSGDFDDLKKPGWLPTAVVVNILAAGDERNGRTVSDDDLILIDDQGSKLVELALPQGFSPDWLPASCEPVEVIDGQHRLWAFENQLDDDHFELPVVAFVGLDISWQAYLFWTINIKPKRINASLAFDLYPLLRTEDWLERFQGIWIYRETRAQELTEAMWAFPESPWQGRINMLGERGVGGVSQAAWIRSLVATYVRPSEGSNVRIGGLFGAPVGEDRLTLPWTRAQQAAFLIRIWSELEDAIQESHADWVIALRAASTEATAPSRQESMDLDDAASKHDPAFAGRFSLLNTDQGVRGYLHITNDLSMLRADEVQLREWTDEDVEGTVSHPAISRALASLETQPVVAFVHELAKHLASFDWRTSAAPGLSENDRAIRTGFRGAGGYKELRRQLLRHVSQQGGTLGQLASEVTSTLGLDD